MSDKLMLTQSALAAPDNLKGVFEIEAFKHNFTQNYLRTTGKDNGEMIFEREKILFMKAITDNKALEKCDRFSIYSSFIELAVSGLSLNDGLTYIIPYGDRAQFQIGWKGRLEQMYSVPEISFVNQPQVVYECDEFDYELGESPKIIKHKPSKERSKDHKITHVYLIIDLYNGAKKTYLMDREEVLTIRDSYSQSYKSYIAACREKNIEPGQPVKKTITKRNGGGTFEITLEPPMWVTSEPEAWKKTIVKRAWKYTPKTARMKALDEKIKSHLDPEDGTQDETHDIDYNIVNDKPEAKETPKTETKKEQPKEQPKQEAPTVPNLGNLSDSF